MIAAFALTAVVMMQAPARDARPAPVVGTATVAGVVASADSQPRPLAPRPRDINGQALGMGRTAITADDGSFAFTALRPAAGRSQRPRQGRIRLHESRRHAHGTSGGAAWQVADGKAVRVSLRLPRGAVITGVGASTWTACPAAGMPVTVLAQRFVGQMGERRYHLDRACRRLAVSDDRGVYRIFGLPAGDYVVAAQPQNRQRGSQDPKSEPMSRGILSDKGVQPVAGVPSGQRPTSAGRRV